MSESETLGDEHLAYWQERLAQPCYVYVIQAASDEPIKIGIAKNVRRRISTLQVGNPRKLQLLFVLPTNSSGAALEIEKELHRRADKSAVRGEWFSGTSADLVLVIVEGMAKRMRVAHDGSQDAPSFWALFPKKEERWNEEEWEYEIPTPAQEGDEEAGIAPLGEEHWPTISSWFMDHWTYEEMAAELDITVGRLERTMAAMRLGGYDLDPRTRRLRDWGMGSVPVVGGRRVQASGRYRRS